MKALPAWQSGGYVFAGVPWGMTVLFLAYGHPLGDAATGGLICAAILAPISLVFRFVERRRRR